MVELTESQVSSLRAIINVKTLPHAREVKAYDECLKDAFYLDTEQAAYGDWSYYLTKDGKVVCTYFSIGD